MLEVTEMSNTTPLEIRAIKVANLKILFKPAKNLPGYFILDITDEWTGVPLVKSRIHVGEIQKLIQYIETIVNATSE